MTNIILCGCGGRMGQAIIREAEGSKSFRIMAGIDINASALATAHKFPIFEQISDFPEKAKRLAEEFWPGPLTMVLSKADIVPKQTTGGLNTVAVRMPVDPTALAFIEAAGGYEA